VSFLGPHHPPLLILGLSLPHRSLSLQQQGIDVVCEIQILDQLMRARYLSSKNHAIKSRAFYSFIDFERFHNCFHGSIVESGFLYPLVSMETISFVHRV
jgi:hypothetical protein